MPHYLPVCLNLENRPVVVIGAGAVGSQRVADLHAAGARITVVSPAVEEGVRALAEAGEIALQLRRFVPGDTEGAFLVAVATDDPAVNRAAYEEADARGVLVNVCDEPSQCNYIFASKIERGPLTVSIFTHGTAPALSRRVRRELESWLGSEYADLAGLLAELRPQVKALPGADQPARQRIFERLVYSELLLLFREGRGDEARALAQRVIAEGSGGD